MLGVIVKQVLHSTGLPALHIIVFRRTLHNVILPDGKFVNRYNFYRGEPKVLYLQDLGTGFPAKSSIV